MGLKDYRTQLNEIFAIFENVDISFEDIEAKIPQERKDASKERLFRTMGNTLTSIKEKIQSMKSNMKK